MASLRALQLPPTPEPYFLHLHYQPDLRTLAARWQRPVSPSEFRQGYLAALAAAEAAACRFWLVDLRARTAPAPAEARWLTTRLLPLLPGRLGGTTYLGMLLSPQFVVPPAPPYPVVLGTSAPAPGVIVRSFDLEGPLIGWLARCQRPASPPVS